MWFDRVDYGFHPKDGGYRSYVGARSLTSSRSPACECVCIRHYETRITERGELIELYEHACYAKRHNTHFRWRFKTQRGVRSF